MRQVDSSKKMFGFLFLFECKNKEKVFASKNFFGQAVVFDASW
jgi:hypothetical protein